MRAPPGRRQLNSVGSRTGGGAFSVRPLRTPAPCGFCLGTRPKIFIASCADRSAIRIYRETTEMTQQFFDATRHIHSQISWGTYSSLDYTPQWTGWHRQIQSPSLSWKLAGVWSECWSRTSVVRTDWRVVTNVVQAMIISGGTRKRNNHR